MKKQKELENVCMEQAAKIEQLNRLVRIYYSCLSKMEERTKEYQYSSVIIYNFEFLQIEQLRQSPTTAKYSQENNILQLEENKVRNYPS